MSALRFYVWGVLEADLPTALNAVRREIRKELQQHNMLLEPAFNWRGMYRLIERKQRRGHRPQRKEICKGDMMGCCRRAVELIDKVTLGGDDHAP